MNSVVELNAKSILLIIGILICIVLITLLIGKVFKKCCRYAFLNNIRIFSLLNMGVFLIPFLIVFIRSTYHLDFIDLWMIIILFVLCFTIPIIVNIYRMGFFYGVSISTFRLIAGSVGCMLSLGVIAVFAMAIICGFAVIEIVYEKTITVTTSNGEILNLTKTDSGLLVDVDTGNTYRNCGGNMLYCNDTGTNTYIYY